MFCYYATIKHNLLINFRQAMKFENQSPALKPGKAEIVVLDKSVWPSLAKPTEPATAENKFYALRRCGAVAPRVLGSSRQRSRTTRTPGGVFLRVAASRYDHIF